MFSVKSGLRWVVSATCMVVSLGISAAQTQSPASSDPVLLDPDHPAVHIVKDGDTLWDISAQFLQHPWQWPALWRWNPAIDDPDLIFPGDQIRLTQDASGPRLVIDRPNSGGGSYVIERRSPRVRTQPLPPAIPLVSSERIKPFIVDHTIVNPSSLAGAGIVIAGDDERLLSGTGDRVFVSDWSLPPGIDRSTASVALVRPGTVYRDPETHEALGQELSLLAWGRVVQAENQVVVVELEEVALEVRSGDRAMSLARASLDPTTHPRAPSSTVQGEILAVNGGMGHVGALDVVVLSVGSRAGATAGDTLAVFHQGPDLKHPVSGDRVSPPPEKSGLVLLFRVFDRLSYGLIVESRRPLLVGDGVGNP
jgi:hypothetical protein